MFDKKIKALGWIFFWVTFFSLAMTINKLLIGTVATSAVIFFRSLFGFGFTTPLLIREEIKIDYKNKAFLHLARIILSCCAMFCTYYAYRHLTLILATAIGFSGPLFTVLAAKLLLKNQISTQRWIALILGYSGVLIALGTTSFSADKLGILSSVAANIFAALAVVCIKILSKTESKSAMVAMSNVGNMIFVLPLFLLNPQIPDLIEFGKLLSIGFFGVMSQYSFMYAISLAETSFVVPFEYLRFILSSALGIMIFKETLTLKLISGTVIIIISAIFVTQSD